jgi:glycosyltransferase involved in cell wall biosynthesis
MSRVLFVAYYFPPIGGAGAQRPARFAAHLPEHGCEASILTGQGASVGRWTPQDTSLEAEMPPEVAVHRVPGPEPSGHRQPRARIERWLGIDSPWTRWWVQGGVEAGREPAAVADVIYTFMSPWPSAELSMRLAAVTGKPWIADLGDPWALDEMALYPTALHRHAELSRMRSALQSASTVVVTAHEAAVRIRETFPELGAKPIVTIPMGYDAADFAGPAPARSDDAFRIVHTGYLHTELGAKQRRAAKARRLLGGQHGSVDILTRSHVYLMDAIGRLDPDLRSRVELHLAGVLSDVDRERATTNVRLHGYLPHAESVALIRSADLLFLPMQNLPVGTRSTMIPGKTYEYLASGRRILAAIPEGDALDILNSVDAARTCRPDDVQEMVRILSEEIRRPRSPAVPGELVERFEYRNLARRVADVVDAAAGGSAPA